MATNNINKLLEDLAAEIKKSTVNSDDISIYGNVSQSFDDLQKVMRDLKRSKGSTLNYGNVKQDLIMSLASLEKVVSGSASQLVSKIQSEVVHTLDSTQDIITEQVKGMNNGISQIRKAYKSQLDTLRQNGERVIKASVSNTITRNQPQLSEQYKPGTIAMPSAMVANTNNAVSKVVTKQLQTSEDILGIALKKSSNTYASAIADLKQFVQNYQSIMDNSMIPQITKQIEGLGGLFDKNFNLNSLKPVTDSILEAIPQEIRDNFKIKSKTTNSEQWASYGADNFYANNKNNVKNFTKQFISDLKLEDLISGGLLKKRIEQIGGNTKGLRIDSDQMEAQLQNMFSRLESFGIGTYREMSKSGQTARIGFFNAKDHDKIFTSSGNGINADWSQMANFTLGIPNSQGNVVVGNMNRPDVFIPRFKNDSGVFKAEMATLSQTILEQFMEVVSSDFFLNALKRGDYKAATSRLNGSTNDLIKNVATNATYGIYSQDAINDINEDMYAGSSPLKRLYQSNTIKWRFALENLYKTTWGNGELPNAEKMEQMMQYMFARFNGNESIFLNNPNYDWLNSGTNQLNAFADFMKKVAPNAGISSKKEIAFLSGDIAGLDSNALAPFFVVNSGVNRSISQGANYTQRAHKLENQRVARMRSAMFEAGGNNYDAAENTQYTMAEVTDNEIASALKDYYTGLGIDATLGGTKSLNTLAQLYKRYIIGHNKKISKEFLESPLKMAEALSNRAMPSTYEGSAIVSDSFLRGLESTRPKTINVTPEDLKTLGISLTPNESNPIVKFNAKDARNAIIKSKQGIKLSDGTIIKGRRQGRTYLGDELQSVSYDPITGKYQLAYKEFLGNEYIKHISGAGDRLTLGGTVTEGEMAAINEYLGLINNPAQIFTEQTKVDSRKIAGLTNKKFEQLFQRIHDVGKDSDLQQYLAEDAKNNGILSRMFDFNASDNTLNQKIFNINKFKETFSQEEATQLFDTFTEKGIYAQLIKKFFPHPTDPLGESQDYKELMSRNIGSTSLGKADEYFYFDPIGSTSKSYAETNSHYKYTKLEEAAIARELGMLKAAGLENSELAEVITDYTSTDAFSKQKLENKKGALSRALNKTKKNINPKEDLYTKLDENGLIDEMVRDGGTISEEAFGKTVLGRAAAGNGQFYIDLTSSVEGSARKKGINISNDIDKPVMIKRLFVPGLEAEKTSDGRYVVDELETAYRDVLKKKQEVENFENSKDFDENSGAYKEAVKAFETSVTSLMADEQNVLEYKKGSLQSKLQNSRVTNAMSAKATTKGFSGIEDSVVISQDDFRDLLSTGVGGNILENIENLAMQANHAFGKSESDNIKGFLQHINNLARTDFSKNGGMTANQVEREIINTLIKMTDVNAEGGAGLQAFFHRNPLINGQDIKATYLRTSSDLLKGRMYTDLGLATDVNMDYDGDTGYLALPMFGAKKANHQLAAQQFDQLAKIQSYVNKALRDHALKEYNKKNELINEDDETLVQQNYNKVRKAMEETYGDSGKLSTLQSILSKSNFKYVGSLDNIAKAMYLSFSDGLDEQSGDALTAGRAILGRTLFEKMTQDSISAKKVGERIRKKYNLGKDASQEDISKAYNDEIDNIRNAISIAKNIGKGKKGSSAKGMEDLVNQLKDSALLNFDEADRTSISAIARVEEMLRIKHGNDINAYRADMEKLGIWDSRVNREYGLRDGEQDQNVSQAGVLTSDIIKKNLKSIANDFEATHGGQSIIGYGYKKLGETGHYLINDEDIAKRINYEVAKKKQSDLFPNIEEESITKKDGTVVNKRYASFHDIASILNPTGATADWSPIERKLETTNEENIQKLLDVKSDMELGELLGGENNPMSEHNVRAFRSAYIKKMIGNAVHDRHSGVKTDEEIGKYLFGEDIFDSTDSDQLIEHKPGMLDRLGISSEEQKTIAANINYRYAKQEAAYRMLNQDIMRTDDNDKPLYKEFNEQTIGAELGARGGNQFFAQGRSDRIIAGQTESGKNVMRFVEWKNVANMGIQEFAQNMLQVATARKMKEYAENMFANDPNATSESIAKSLNTKFGNGFKGNIDADFIRQLIDTDYQDITGQLIGTDRYGNTKTFRMTSNNIPKEVLDAIEEGKTISSAISNNENAQKAVENAYREDMLGRFDSDNSEAAQIKRPKNKVNADNMFDEYSRFVTEKQAIEQNYQTLQAQLAGMSEKHPQYNALKKRLDNLKSLKEGYSNTYYQRDVDEKGNSIISKYVKNKDGVFEPIEYAEANEKLVQSFENVEGGAEKQNAAMAKIAKTNATVTKTISGLAGQFKGMLQYYAMYGMVQKVIGAIMQTFQKFVSTVKELDSALVNLQIVTGKSKNELESYVSSYIDIADKMGRTTTEVMSAANDWLRAGYDIKDANLLIQDSLKLSTLGMMDAEKATEALLSTMKGWKLTAEEVSGVVDNLTALDVAYATSAGDIATAMSKGNVSASLAGVDMKNYEAYLTTVLDVSQQSAETVGTAFKTLFARYGNVKSGKYANNYNFGESDQETTEDTTKLNDVETVLNKIGIKTRDTIGEFRSMDEVLDEVASKWASYDKVTKNAITTAMAGTRQREVLNVLFENYGEVEKARNIIDNSEGSADKKYEAYNNSIEAGQKRLTNAIQEIAQGEGWKNVLIDIYDILKTGTDVLGVILDNLKPIAIGAAVLFGLKNIGAVAGTLSRIGSIGSGFFSNIGSGIKNTVTGGFFRDVHDNGFKNAIRPLLSDYADAQARYEYGVGLNRTATQLNSRLASSNDLGYNLNTTNGIFSGNVFTADNYNSATKFLSNSNVIKQMQNFGPQNVNSLFQSSLTALNNEQVAMAYNNYIAALNGGATSEEALAPYRDNLKAALGYLDNSAREATTEILELAAKSKMTGDDLAASGLIMQRNGNRNRIPNVSHGGNNNSGFWESNLGQSVGNIGGMALGMGGSALIMRHASQDLGTGWTMALSMATSMLPMIGNAIMPGLGGLIGGGVSALIGFGTTIWAKSHKTSEEILQEAQKATEELNKIRDKISTAEETRSKLEDNEVRFAELVKGVNSATGKNVSLSDSEWSEYQTILSSIIDSRDDLYASYDAEGNIVAKNAQGIANLNAVMAESIQLQKDKIRQENENLAKDTDTLSQEISGDIENAKTEYKNINSPLSFVPNSNYTQVSASKIFDYNIKYGGDNSGFMNQDLSAPAKNSNDLSVESLSIDDAENHIINLIRKGINLDDFIDLMTSAGQITKKEAEEYYIKLQKSDQVKGRNEVDKAYNESMKKYIGYALKGNEEFLSLSENKQSFIQDQLFSNNISAYNADGSKKTEKQRKEDIEAYQKAAVTIAKLSKSGDINLDSIVNYDKTTDNAEKDEKYGKSIIDIINQTDLNEYQKVALLEGYGFVKDSEGKWITQRQSNTNVLTGNDYGFNEKTLEQLSTEQLNALYENRGEEYLKLITDPKKLKQELSKLILGENATLSEYFADFANQTDTSLSDIEGLKEALANPENQDLFSLKKIKESFKELGYDVEKTDVLAEALTKHMSTLGSIDTNGYTSKSLSEIKSQFEDIDSIVSDLVDNGKLSVENMQKLLEEFPEMIKYLGEGKDLLEAMEELQKDQAELQFASIKNTIAESEENYTEFLSTLKKEGKINDNLKDYLGMFGNSKNLVSLFNQMYQEDEDGNYTLKSRYKDMRLMDNSDFSQNSWEKIIGKYIFGIDTTTGTKEDISRKISDAVQAQADKLGLEGSTPEFIDIYRNMMMNNPEFIGAFQNIADLENQLAAAKASQQLENSQWEEKVSKEISKLKDAFDAGKISIDDYIKGLQEIRRWSNLTEEQIRELDEAIEDAKFDKLSDQFDKGQISVKNYREELSKLMKDNALGSDDYNKFLEAYLGTYDTEISKLENQKSLLADKDFQGQKNILNQENLIYEEKLAALTAAGQKNSETYLEVLEKIKSNKEQQLEITKQELEYEKEKLETVMDAYSTLIDYRINQLQKEKDLLEERYDDEIDKLKEVNDQKQRSIDLEKYQQELENARKEKSRIYISGVGWTYQANQAKVDEAQTNLDNYLEDRKISDLENSKNREAKYYQDQIDFWNETKEKIEDVPKLANAEEAVKELIRNNVVAEGSTINTALTDIKKGITVDVDGHVVDLGIKFNTFSNNYSTVTSNLNDLNSAMDGKLGAISDWIKSYKSANDMVEALKKAFTAGVSNLNINKPQQSTVNWDKKIGEITNRLDAAKRALNDQTTILASVFTFLGTTTSSGTWKKGANVVDTSRGYAGVDGRTYWKMTNTETGKQYAILANKSNVWTKKGDPYGKAYANYGTALYGSNILIGGSFSGGIEEGMVSRTGLYKLHGTPNNPEFVLNSKQAYQLLRNISTLSIPAFESKTSTNKTINYQFYGDMNLPNVKDPSTFFSELLREADGKFNVTKLEY